jgi:hypothetical protein
VAGSRIRVSGAVPRFGWAFVASRRQLRRKCGSFRGKSAASRVSQTESRWISCRERGFLPSCILRFLIDRRNTVPELFPGKQNSERFPARQAVAG